MNLLPVRLRSTDAQGQGAIPPCRHWHPGVWSLCYRITGTERTTENVLQIQDIRAVLAHSIALRCIVASLLARHLLLQRV
jgi:hypothetical protein